MYKAAVAQWLWVDVKDLRRIWRRGILLPDLGSSINLD